MIQEKFFEQFLEQIIVLSHVNEEDNYDKYRFGYDGVDRSKDVDVARLSSNLKYVFENRNDIQRIINFLDDDESQNIVFKVLLYRSLGHLHVKLPRNNGNSET